MEPRQAVGLLGIVLAAIAAQLNDAVLNSALPDVAGHLDIGMDLASWLRTLFITGEVIGMCCSPSLGLGLSFRRFALIAIAMNTLPTLLMMFGSGSLPILPLRFFQGLGAGFTIPLVLTIGLRSLGPDVRLYGLCVYALHRDVHAQSRGDLRGVVGSTSSATGASSSCRSFRSPHCRP